MTTLEEIRSITNEHDSLAAMEEVAAHFNIAYDDPIGCYPNKSGKNVDDCDTFESLYGDLSFDNGNVFFGWDNDNENAGHAMELIRYINSHRNDDEFNE